eukprot:6177803-Pleurochrysis_carterae.AAC.2
MRRDRGVCASFQVAATLSLPAPRARHARLVFSGESAHLRAVRDRLWGLHVCVFCVLGGGLKAAPIPERNRVVALNNPFVLLSLRDSLTQTSLVRCADAQVTHSFNVLTLPDKFSYG